MKRALWVVALAVIASILFFGVWLAVGPSDEIVAKVASGPMDTLRLRDGRTLAYRVIGDPAGKPVLMLHGIPGSRLLYVAPEDEFKRRGIRFIQIDRPGFGGSTPAPEMRFTGHGADVAQLMDHLGVGRFYVLGWSAGTPWALALGESLSQRVVRIAVVGALMPPDEPKAMAEVRGSSKVFYWLARHWPNALGRAFEMMDDQFTRDPDAFFHEQNIGHPVVDLALIKSPRMAASLKLCYVETLRNGPRNLAAEVRRMASPWGIKWQRVQVPVRFWHGSEDIDTPLQGSEVLAKRIQGAMLTTVQGEGHYLILPRIGEILDWLVME